MYIVKVTNGNLDFYGGFMPEWIRDAVRAEAAYGYAIADERDGIVRGLAFVSVLEEELELLHMELFPAGDTPQVRHGLMERLKQDVRELELAGIRAEDMERKGEERRETEAFLEEEGFLRDAFWEEYLSVPLKAIGDCPLFSGKKPAGDKIVSALSLSGESRNSLLILMEDEAQSMSEEVTGVPMEELCLAWMEGQTVEAYLMVTDVRGRLYIKNYGCLAGKEELLDELLCEASLRALSLGREGEERLYLFSQKGLAKRSNCLLTLEKKGALQAHVLADYVWDAYAEEDVREGMRSIEEKKRQEKFPGQPEAYRLYELEEMLEELGISCRFGINRDGSPCVEAEFVHYGQTYPVRVSYILEDENRGVYTLCLESRLGDCGKEGKEEAVRRCNEYNREIAFGCAYWEEGCVYLRAVQTEAGEVISGASFEALIALFGMARRELMGRF